MQRKMQHVALRSETSLTFLETTGDGRLSKTKDLHPVRQLSPVRESAPQNFNYRRRAVNGNTCIKTKQKMMAITIVSSWETGITFDLVIKQCFCFLGRLFVCLVQVLLEQIRRQTRRRRAFCERGKLWKAQSERHAFAPR